MLYQMLSFYQIDVKIFDLRLLKAIIFSCSFIILKTLEYRLIFVES
jgi:hypothetical protein